MNALRLFVAASVVLATALALAPSATAGPIECGNGGPTPRTCNLLVEEPNCLQTYAPTRWASECRDVVDQAAAIALCYVNPPYLFFDCL